MVGLSGVRRIDGLRRRPPRPAGPAASTSHGDPRLGSALPLGTKQRTLVETPGSKPYLDSPRPRADRAPLADAPYLAESGMNKSRRFGWLGRDRSFNRREVARNSRKAARLAA